MQPESQPGQQRPQPYRLESARDCAKDYLRDYVQEGWTLEELIGGHIATHQPAYDMQIGVQGGKVVDPEGHQRTLKPDQVLVTCVNGTKCFVILDLAELIAEIRDEQRGYYRQPLDLFSVEVESQEQPEEPP